MVTWPIYSAIQARQSIVEDTAIWWNYVELNSLMNSSTNKVTNELLYRQCLTLLFTATLLVAAGVAAYGGSSIFNRAEVAGAIEARAVLI